MEKPTLAIAHLSVPFRKQDANLILNAIVPIFSENANVIPD